MNNKKGRTNGGPKDQKLNANNSLKRYEYQDQFKAFARGLGVLVPDAMATDGSLQRCGTEGKPTGKDGSYTYHDDERPAGFVQNMRTGVKENWSSGASAPRLSREEWQKQQEQRKQEAKARARAEAEKHQAAASKAMERYYKAVPAFADHAYLVKQSIQPHNAKQLFNNLLITFHNVAGEVMTDQTISPKGDKRLLKGGKKSGAFCVIGAKLSALDTVARVFLCEGWATGASIYEHYGEPVLVAIDAGNLIKVVEAIRQRWQFLPVVVMADNDRKAEHEGRANAGVMSAKAVANQFLNVSVEIPIFPEDAPIELSDFNDLVNYRKAKCSGGEA